MCSLLLPAGYCPTRHSPSMSKGRGSRGEEVRGEGGPPHGDTDGDPPTPWCFSDVLSRLAVRMSVLSSLRCTGFHPRNSTRETEGGLSFFHI